MNYRKKLYCLIVIATLIRVLISSGMELGNSEVYYWVYSLHLQWNYFDHPPIVGWLIRLTTLNNILHNELAVRAGAIFSAGICTYIIFKIGETISDQQTGWYAAILYTSAFYSSIAVGAFILPDSPQMVFWLAGVLILLKIMRSPDNSKEQNVLWCLFGLISGLCIMSKIHGIFLWLGVLLFSVTIKHCWLKNRWIYLAGLITCFIVSPILIWNIHHHFVTYSFHSRRVSVLGFAIDFPRFLKQLSAIILICNPVNFFLICTSLVYFASGRLKLKHSDIILILLCSLPLILMLTVVSFFREIYPHWPGPAFSVLLVLPALMYSRKNVNEPKEFPGRFKWALGILVLLIVIQLGMTLYFPGTLSNEKDLYAGKGDPTLDMYEWKEAGISFDSLFKMDVAKKVMSPGSPLLVTEWYPAAHLDFYFADKTGQQTIGIGDIDHLHQYYWFNEYKKRLRKGDNAYYIIPSNLMDYKVFDRIINLFTSYEMPLTIEQYRSGVLCRQIYIFRLKGYQDNNQNRFLP